MKFNYKLYALGSLSIPILMVLANSLDSSFVKSKSSISVWLFIYMFVFSYFSLKKDVLKPYFKWVDATNSKDGNLLNRVSGTLIIAVLIIITNMALTIITKLIHLMPNDPQNLNGRVFDLDSATTFILHLPFNTIAEDTWRLASIMTAYILISKIGIRSTPLKVALLVFIPSMFFGLLHVPSWGYEVLISHTIHSLPVIVAILYFRSIVPVIISHALSNGATMLSKIGIGFDPLAFYMVVVVISVGLFFLSLNRNRSPQKAAQEG